MADVFDRAKRSQVMSRIRGKGNKATELALISLFRAYGITGWRRGRPVYGKPDFIFPKGRIAVFVDGCFWHFCPKHGKIPKSNETFWLNKLNRNMKRDLTVTKALKQSGWRVIRIWECSLNIRDAKANRQFNRKIRELQTALRHKINK